MTYKTHFASAVAVPALLPAERAERAEKPRRVGLPVVLVALPSVLVLVGLVLLFLVLVVDVAADGTGASADQGTLAGIAAE